MKERNVKETAKKSTLNSRNIAKRCAKAARGKKAKDIVIMKVKDISSITDFFVLCSGSSEKHVETIADSIERELKKEMIRCLGSEGLGKTRWVVKDYGSVIVHVFHEETREKYSLERLWGDAEFL